MSRISTELHLNRIGNWVQLRVGEFYRSDVDNDFLRILLEINVEKFPFTGLFATGMVNIYCPQFF